MNFIVSSYEIKNQTLNVHLSSTTSVGRLRKTIKGLGGLSAPLSRQIGDSFSPQYHFINYVFHFQTNEKEEYPRWVDIENGITRDLRAHILLFSADKRALILEGLNRSLIDKVINSEIAMRRSILINHFPTMIGIKELTAGSGVWVVFDLDRDTKIPIIEVLSTDGGIKGLMSLEEYFNSISLMITDNSMIVMDYATPASEYFIESLVFKHYQLPFMSQESYYRKEESMRGKSINNPFISPDLDRFYHIMNGKNTIIKSIGRTSFSDLRKSLLVKNSDFFSR